MGRVDWYPPGHPDMDGAENVEHAVSYTKPVQSGLQRYSTSISREASAILSMTEHRPNQERAEIGVVHRGHSGGDAEVDVKTWLDSIVYLKAPDERDPEGADGSQKRKRQEKMGSHAAVQSIEFGHYSSARAAEGIGPLTKRAHKRVWVEGVAPLRKAAAKAARNPRLSIR